jgi:hypothetical protein
VVFTHSSFLYQNCALAETHTGQDADALTIDSVKLGAMNIETTIRGTVCFNDYESHRLREIGLLPDPGTHEPTPTPAANWIN